MLPKAGVAQGIFHGILVRHHGRIQEEVEERLEDEVERHKEEENTQEQMRMPMTMDRNEDTQTRLEPQVTYERMYDNTSKRRTSCSVGAQLSRPCGSWRSCNWSLCAQGCSSCACRMYAVFP